MLFAVDPKDGTVNPLVLDNIPGLEHLKTADLMIIATRWRNLPDEQMRHVVEYVESGRPILGLRTATHAFRFPAGKTYSRYSYDSRAVGRRLRPADPGRDLDQSPRAATVSQSTRGLIAPGEEKNPIVRGCEDIWGPTDVYEVRLPLPGDSRPLVMGQVLEGMKPTDKPVAGPKNEPMMPVAWTKTYRSPSGNVGRVFTTTMGAARDLESEGLRRLLVNASFWCLGMEDKIPARAEVGLVGEYKPLEMGYGKFKPGMKPADYALR